MIEGYTFISRNPRLKEARRRFRRVSTAENAKLIPQGQSFQGVSLDLSPERDQSSSLIRAINPCCLPSGESYWPQICPRLLMSVNSVKIAPG